MGRILGSADENEICFGLNHQDYDLLSVKIPRIGLCAVICIDALVIEVLQEVKHLGSH